MLKATFNCALNDKHYDVGNILTLGGEAQTIERNMSSTDEEKKKE